jgi:carbamoyltransferase
MGLAPYGEPIYENKIRKYLIEIKDDGSFWLNQDYFNYCVGLTMTSPKFHALFGQPPRTPESKLTKFHMDVAASIQKLRGKRDHPTRRAVQKDLATARSRRCRWKSRGRTIHVVSTDEQSTNS